VLFHGLGGGGVVPKRTGKYLAGSMPFALAVSLRLKNVPVRLANGCKMGQEYSVHSIIYLPIWRQNHKIIYFS
jgi:hypothetical protein